MYEMSGDIITITLSGIQAFETYFGSLEIMENV